MSTKLEDRLIGCAPAPERGFDVEAVIRQGLRRRRRRNGLRVAGSAIVLAVVAVMSVRPDPPGTSVVFQGTATSEQAAPAQSALAREWVEVRAGETLDISLRDWQEFPTASGNPTIDDAWSSRVRDMVRTKDVFALAVAPDGAAIFSHEGERGAILAHADGTQRVVARDLTNIAAVHTPSGHWLLLGQNASGARFLKSISADGEVLTTQALESYPARVGQVLQVRGDEVWVVAAWEVIEGHGPREALLATHGGETLMSDVTWQPAHDSSADAGPHLESRSPTSFDIALQDGIARLALDVTDPGRGQGEMVTASVRVSNADGAYMLHVHVAERGIGQRGHERVVVPSSAPPDLSLLVVHSGDRARVTRLTSRSQRDTVLADATGALWFVQTNADGYRLSRLAR